MQQNDISILSTRPLDELLVGEAKNSGITIDVLSFIETATIHSTEVQQEIENIILQSSTVVFTSMNAVEAIADELQDQEPDWRIYCIGNTTEQLVRKYFGENSIAGSASSAAALAELIINDGQEDEVIFFCGDQRRDELPQILKSNDIGVNEIIVYETIAIKQKVEKQYHGILFFSPSAVESFFSNNQIEASTVLFAIGNTTADSLKNFAGNKIIIGDEPGKENLFRKMMEYFT